MDAFVESGMTFGPYPDGTCFRIEHSTIYKNLGDHIKTAEFLLVKADDHGSQAVWIVEAKSSAPRSDTQPDFETFIGEIRDKLTNAFSLGVAGILGRHPDGVREISEILRSISLAEVRVRLVLILRDHPQEHLSPVKDKLNAALRAIVKTWNLDPLAVVVLNHAGAQKYGLTNSP